ncbi:MAG: hypothetical protein K0R57_5372 [Paenibacillaceae bacterium]|nr:hypothetical protein [Paenibacillaceae bacterium]
MKKRDYKRVLDTIKPDEAMEQRLYRRLSAAQTGTRRSRRFMYAAVSAMVLVLLAGAFYLGPGGRGGLTGSRGNHPASDRAADGGIQVPKLELPKNSNGALADMIGLIIYQGRIYTQTSTRIDAESAKAIRGEHIGRTKGGIDEWSRKGDYDLELASSIGEADVYKVQGYDSAFRLMIYEEHEEGVWVEFLECQNGIEVRNGGDWFGGLNLKGRVASAVWQNYKRWSNYVETDGTIGEGGQVPVKTELNDFIAALDKSVPVPSEQMRQLESMQKPEENQRALQLTLTDHAVVELMLYKEGYVSYGWRGVCFKVDEAVFNKLWNSLG